MTSEIRALLSRHLPGYVFRAMLKVGEGSDNVVYEVNGELMFRISKEMDPAVRSETVRRERNLLAAVPEFSTLPVPTPVFTDIEAGVFAYRKLPGLPILDHPVPEPERLAAPLGEFTSRLHQASTDVMGELVERDDYSMAAWLHNAEQDYRRVSEHIPVASCRLIEDFLGDAPPAESHDMAFCHNDLGAEHILVNVGTNSIAGVIDWTDAAITDPARDLALIYRDLGPDVFELTLASYECPFDSADRERAVFYARCKLIEDIAYGVSSGANRYTKSGLSHLAWTFA